MPSSRTESEVSNVKVSMNVETLASGLLKITEESSKNKVWESDTKCLLTILQGIIALQLAIYRELKKDLMETDSKT